MADFSRGTLAGLRIIDLTRVLGGPYCTQTLADLGADVVKIEPPGGDETRQWGPPFKDGRSAYFSGANRNKRAVALDLSKPEGRHVLLKMLAGADVLVHNFKSGTMERWGLGYDEFLKEKFPRLIHCHITGFGDSGPLGGLPGYDAVVQAMTGLMSINGASDSGPCRIGLPIVDIGTGLIATIGILAAAVERQSSGLGQKLEVSLYDSAISLLHPHAANYLMSAKIPGRTGNAHPNIAPYDMFDTATKQLYLAVGNNGQFAKLCAAIGLPRLPEDTRFSSNAERVRNAAALKEILSDRLAEFDAEALEQTLLRSGVPAGVVRDLHEALNHPHTKYGDMVVAMGDYSGTGVPYKFGRCRRTGLRAPAKLGQDNGQILTELGFTPEEIEHLAETKVSFTES